MPGDFDRKRIATRYDIGSSFIYIGQADYVDSISEAPDESSPAWTIRRITLIGGSPTASEWTLPGSGVWTDRSSESYT